MLLELRQLREQVEVLRGLRGVVIALQVENAEFRVAG